MYTLPVKVLYKDSTVNLALDTVERDKQALVFVNTKKSAEKVAEEISKKLAGGEKLAELAEKVRNDLTHPTQQCERLARCCRKGVAFHHAGLTSNQKTFIEDAFREGTLRIISCTPTLAAGLDLPAFRTIIRDLKRFGPRGMTQISVLEYLQMAGRAGRPDYEHYGESICVSSSEAEKDAIISEFVSGEPEEIYSKLAVEPALRTYVLSLIATGFVSTREEIFAFFKETFWAHQFGDMGRIGSTIQRMLELLVRWEFLTGGGGQDFVSASDMGDERYRATNLGKRVAELYIDPLTARGILDGLVHVSQIGNDDFALLHLISYTLEMRPLLRVGTKEEESMDEALAAKSCYAQRPSPFEPEYEDYLNAAKTAMCLQDWIEEEPEEHLLERYAIRPGELRMKLETADWLLYATHELSRIAGMRLQAFIQRMRTRLQHGVKEELLPLLKLHGIGRVWARKMFHNGIKDLGDARSMPDKTLAAIIGPRRAQSVKKQLGVSPGEMPPTEKRQQQLHDFG